jgi:hypothetical protein
MSEEDPKIVVDADWKTQVEKEKAMAADRPGGETVASPAEPTAAPAEPNADAVADRPDNGAGRSASDRDVIDRPPPATFETLVTMLFTQALAALGQLPGPDGQLGSVNKPFAKYFIDTLEMLGEKTEGNLSDDENKLISETLHAMRMAFVSVKAK